MSVIQVKIEGTRPILFNNPAQMQKPTTGKKYVPNPEQEAKDACYWSEDQSTLVLPSWNLYRSIVKAAAAYKGVGKGNASTILAGAIELEPLQLNFNTKQYDIHICRVVIQGSGIMRARPQLKTWSLQFNIVVYDGDMAGVALDTLKNIVEEAGRRVGVGDFRPEKKGPFGKFKVTAWEVRNGNSKL